MTTHPALPHIYGTLNSLERYLGSIKKKTEGPAQDNFKFLKQLAPQLEQTLTNMRKAANRLQFAIAANKHEEIVRELKVFYGLNHLLRPEILAAYLQVSHGQEVASTHDSFPRPALH